MDRPEVLRLIFKPGITKHFKFKKDEQHLIVEETLTSDVNCVPIGSILVKYGDDDLRGKSEKELTSLRARNRSHTQRTLVFYLPGCPEQFLDSKRHKKVRNSLFFVYHEISSNHAVDVS